MWRNITQLQAKISLFCDDSSTFQFDVMTIFHDRFSYLLESPAMFYGSLGLVGWGALLDAVDDVPSEVNSGFSFAV